jgi:hypothetical protein
VNGASRSSTVRVVAPVLVEPEQIEAPRALDRHHRAAVVRDVHGARADHEAQGGLVDHQQLARAEVLTGGDRGRVGQRAAAATHGAELEGHVG